MHQTDLKGTPVRFTHISYLEDLYHGGPTLQGQARGEEHVLLLESESCCCRGTSGKGLGGIRNQSALFEANNYVRPTYCLKEAKC